MYTYFQCILQQRLLACKRLRRNADDERRLGILQKPCCSPPDRSRRSEKCNPTGKRLRSYRRNEGQPYHCFRFIRHYNLRNARSIQHLCQLWKLHKTRDDMAYRRCQWKSYKRNKTEHKGSNEPYARLLYDLHDERSGGLWYGFQRA